MDKVFYEKCKKRLNKIADFMVYQNQPFYVLMQLRDLQEKHNELINISPAFYQCVISNCIKCLFVEEYKMFDPKKDNDGIFGLLNAIKDNLDKFDLERAIEANETTALNSPLMETHRYSNIEELVNESIEKINGMQNIIGHVKVLREKYYAHFEEGVDFDKLFQTNEVSLVDIESLLVLNANLINALYMYFNNTTLYPLAINYDDFSKTVFYIQKGVEQ